MRAFEDLTLLRAFDCIVECGSISAGARRLRISQPTLSRQLRTLEELCGTALLRRDTHRMSVTETGQRLLADAAAMLAHATNQGFAEGRFAFFHRRWCAGNEANSRRPTFHRGEPALARRLEG